MTSQALQSLEVPVPVSCQRVAATEKNLVLHDHVRGGRDVAAPVCGWQFLSCKLKDSEPESLAE
jgi:hypothetical protein